MINTVLLLLVAIWFFGLVTDIRVMLVLAALWYFGFLDDLIGKAKSIAST